MKVKDLRCIGAETVLSNITPGVDIMEFKVTGRLALEREQSAFSTINDRW